MATTDPQFLSNDSWDYICTILKTEFAKYVEKDGIATLLDIFKTVEVTQGETVTNIVAKETTDTLKIVGGSNVSITANASTKSITIASDNTTYTFSVGSGENADKIMIVSSDDTANPIYLTAPFATKAEKDSDSNVINTTYAKLASPTFTGVPKAPTPTDSSNDTTIATTAFVQSVVSKVSGISLDGPYASLDALKEAHPVGELGVIYLVSQTDEEGVSYNDEYYWNTKKDPADYELFGTTKIDLSLYLKKTSVMTNDAILAAWNAAVPITPST